MLRVLTLATLICAPGVAPAETRIERMERLSVAMQDKLYDLIEAEMPVTKGNLPDTSWNDEIRTAASCSLASYEAQIGGARVDEMLDEMEAIIDEPIQDINGLIDSMEFDSGLSNAENAAIEAECQMGEATMNKMMADPKFQSFMGAMAQMMAN